MKPNCKRKIQQQNNCNKITEDRCAKVHRLFTSDKRTMELSLKSSAYSHTHTHTAGESINDLRQLRIL